MSQYTVYHLHSDLSNAVTTIDSCTKFSEYIDRAKELGMKALGFSEHGSVLEWWHKKCAVEAAGMKFIYATECYLTSTLEEKIRDNYHCVLIAKNYEGFLELNSLVSTSFNRKDNHYYYVPRIGFSELFNTSDNILITTACIGGVLYKGTEQDKEVYLDYLIKNRHRCFLEIQHHADPKQVEYNKALLGLANDYELRLIAGTDTHALNEDHVDGRKILQKSKGIEFADEDNWDLTFKSYDGLCEAYDRQNAIPKDRWQKAIQNTNLLADMVEAFTIDKSVKYPHITDDPEKVFKGKVDKAIEAHPYALKNYSREELDGFVDEELEVYRATGAIDYMLLQAHLREWERLKGIRCGYGRGSVSGSMIAYLLGVTEMDSKRFDLNMFRFLNPSRVTVADIDTDYGGKDRDMVKEFLLRDKMGLPNIQAAEIITFNTIALKGAIRDVARALDIPLAEVNEISKRADSEGDIVKLRKENPELFRYVDIVNGTIVSVGTHPSGVLISDLNINEVVGLYSTSTSDYPISMLNMKELEDLSFVKLDILGVDNITVINKTCEAVGIDRLTPDNVDLEDEAVWKSIKDDTTGVFQWESDSAQAYLKKFMSEDTLAKVKKDNTDFSMIKWFSFGNGLIRPACASFRNSVAEGEVYDNGLKELNDFLKPTRHFVVMQEDIMRFLVEFCGYSQGQSDSVRRSISKKGNTENLIPEIESRFISETTKKYGVPEEKCKEIIKPFLQTIIDASSYAFSWNHSDSYSCIGYICGYLRHYYPLEFLAEALNAFADNEEKTVAFTNYANRLKIKINPPRFRYSNADYTSDKNTNSIYKGMSSIKYLSADVSNQLYGLRGNKYDTFVELLLDIADKTATDKNQLEILIKLDFFSEFGNSKELLRINDMFLMLKKGKAKKISKEKVLDEAYHAIAPYVSGANKDGKPAKSYTFVDMIGSLKALEQGITSLNIHDFDYKNKIQNQLDFLGYVDIATGSEDDRRKLLVKNIYPLKRKRDGRQFGYSVITRSIGSGVESRFTVLNRTYENEPVKKGDIILCIRYTPERDKKTGTLYYTLNSYEKVQ